MNDRENSCPTGRSEKEDYGMNESDSDKNGGIEKSAFGSFMLAILKYIFETYLSLNENPLPGWKRFLFSWIGSAALFSTAPVKSATKTEEYLEKIDKYLEEAKNDLRDELFRELLPTDILIVFMRKTTSEFVGLFFIMVIFPSLIAMIIASSKTRHGPIGLFISGLMLTAFVSTVGRIWGIGG